MGLGGALMKNGQAVAYASRQLRIPERNYLTRDVGAQVDDLGGEP